MSFISQSLWLVAILLALLSFTDATDDLSTVEMPMSARHEKWMAQYGRVYKDAEEKAHRFEIFKANAEYVQSVNRAENQTYWLGLNQFADLTNEEFKASYLGFKPKSLTVKEVLDLYSLVFVSIAFSTIKNIMYLKSTLLLVEQTNCLRTLLHDIN